MGRAARDDGRTDLGRERRARLARARLYLIVTVPAAGWEAALLAALATDTIGIVQLRDLEGREAGLRARAARVRAACRRHGALFVLNDRCDLVEAVDADGAHVGQEDLPAAQARALVGAERILGLSTHDAGEIARAASLPVDYLGLGPCFATGSKTLLRTPGGPDLVARAAPRAGARVLYPIGGITPANAHSLVRAGARRLAVGAGILSAPDPAGAARALAALLP